jgi:hypothetical protein
VTYPGFTPVGNATLVVANVLTCNKHSHMLAHGAPSEGQMLAASTVLLAKFATKFVVPVL